VAKKRYQRMTAEEKAAQLERQRFIDEVVREASRRAGIGDSQEDRLSYIDRVVADIMARRRGEATGLS
jgi:hypothetical protein